MPRKSAAAQTVDPDFELARPEAPYHLSDEESAIWRQIVGSLPPEYFAEFQHDLLGLLCGHLAEARYVRTQLYAERRKKKPNLKIAADWKLQWAKETTTINQLMRAMRLTHQSVYHHEKAANAHRLKDHAGVPQGDAAELWDENDEAEAAEV